MGERQRPRRGHPRRGLRGRPGAAAFLSNSSLPPWQVITLQRDLADALAGRPGHAEPPAVFERFDKDTRSSVVGRYAADGLGTVTVSAGAEGVGIRVEAGLEFETFQVSDEVFYVPGLDYWLAFSGGQRPTAMHIRSMFLDTLGRRLPESPGPGPSEPPQVRVRGAG